MIDDELPNMELDFWKDRSEDETSFWRRWVKSRGGKWSDDFERRTDPENPLIDSIRGFLRTLGVEHGQTVDILDIGSGPLSILGYKCSDWDIRLTLIDPLSDRYNKILDRAGISGVPRPSVGYFETAVEQLGKNRFDIVWCRNALDHSMDPLLGLYNLICLCKMDGGLFLSFHPDEGDGGGYEGLHQWNLRLEGDKLLLTQKGRKLDLTPLLHAQELISIDQGENSQKHKGLCTIKIKKIKEPNLSQAMCLGQDP